jgi:hypothetical protein
MDQWINGLMEPSILCYNLEILLCIFIEYFTFSLEMVLRVSKA